MGWRVGARSLRSKDDRSFSYQEDSLRRGINRFHQRAITRLQQLIIWIADRFLAVIWTGARDAPACNVSNCLRPFPFPGRTRLDEDHLFDRSRDQPFVALCAAGNVHKHELTRQRDFLSDDGLLGKSV